VEELEERLSRHISSNSPHEANTCLGRVEGLLRRSRNAADEGGRSFTADLGHEKHVTDERNCSATIIIQAAASQDF